ncbi:hypothetical protein EDD11_000887 [Mortierella claussenii]|nr:hypothetical protein EDD11_000887 [Mortierella claussenii]
MTAAVNASLRMVRAPVQALARRQYSAAASATPAGSPAAAGHSTQRLIIASGVSALLGADVTYAYFTFFKKQENSA